MLDLLERSLKKRFSLGLIMLSVGFLLPMTSCEMFEDAGDNLEDAAEETGDAIEDAVD